MCQFNCVMCACSVYTYVCVSSVCMSVWEYVCMYVCASLVCICLNMYVL